MLSARLALIASIILACSAFGCAKPVGPAPPPVSVASPPAPPPDLSLPSIEYVALGMPAYDRGWSGADMGKAADVLASLAAEPSPRFPRFESPRSGAMFARVTSAENLSLFLNTSLPVHARLLDFVAYIEGLNRIQKLYLAAFQAGHAGPRDMIELMGSMVRLGGAGLIVSDEYMAALPADDPNRAAKMEGFRTMHDGIGMLVSAALLTLTEKHVYPAEDRLALVEHLRQALPPMLPRMTEAARVEIPRRVREMAADPALADLRPALRELSAAIEEGGGR